MMCIQSERKLNLNIMNKSSHLNYLCWNFNDSIFNENIPVLHCCIILYYEPSNYQLNHFLSFKITAKKRSVYDFIRLFLFTYRSYTRFPRIPVPEFSVLVILVTFTYHMYTRTAIYQPHTRIYYIYQLYTNL